MDDQSCSPKQVENTAYDHEESYLSDVFRVRQIGAHLIQYKLDAVEEEESCSP
jgi:hypothetical protein